MFDIVKELSAAFALLSDIATSFMAWGDQGITKGRFNVLTLAAWLKPPRKHVKLIFPIRQQPRHK